MPISDVAINSGVALPLHVETTLQQLQLPNKTEGLNTLPHNWLDILERNLRSLKSSVLA